MRTRIWNMFVVAALLSTVGMLGCKNGEKAGTGLAEPVAISESVSGNSAALKSIGAWHIETKEAYDALGGGDHGVGTRPRDCLLPGEEPRRSAFDCYAVSLGADSRRGKIGSEDCRYTARAETRIQGSCTNFASQRHGKRRFTRIATIQ